ARAAAKQAAERSRAAAKKAVEKSRPYVEPALERAKPAIARGAEKVREAAGNGHVPASVAELRIALDDAVASGRKISHDKPLVTRLI
ncbi:MAG: hypothetical protein ACRDZ7_22590, partial [Acidimicrobiia bacterium]